MIWNINCSLVLILERLFKEVLKCTNNKIKYEQNIFYNFAILLPAKKWINAVRTKYLRKNVSTFIIILLYIPDEWWLIGT